MSTQPNDRSVFYFDGYFCDSSKITYPLKLTLFFFRIPAKPLPDQPKNSEAIFNDWYHLEGDGLFEDFGCESFAHAGGDHGWSMALNSLEEALGQKGANILDSKNQAIEPSRAMFREIY